MAKSKERLPLKFFLLPPSKIRKVLEEPVNMRKMSHKKAGKLQENQFSNIYNWVIWLFKRSREARIVCTKSSEEI